MGFGGLGFGGLAVWDSGFRGLRFRDLGVLFGVKVSVV